MSWITTTRTIPGYWWTETTTADANRATIERQRAEIRQLEDHNVKQAKKVAELAEENGDLKDIVKQVVGRLLPGTIGATGTGTVACRLGRRPDLRLKIVNRGTDDQFRSVIVTKAPPPAEEETGAAVDPRQVVVEALKKHAAPFLSTATAEELLKELERSGLRIYSAGVGARKLSAVA